MADFLTKSQRSALMASIKGKANKGTELRLAELFREHGIKGWRRHYPISGKPDFVFTKAKLAIFVDGCFWHGCPWHYRPPTSNVAFWKRKIEDNRNRDKKANAKLRQKGWTVIRIWEHSLRQPERILARIQSALDYFAAQTGDSENELTENRKADSRCSIGRLSCS
jgi:DNA mismatch endonuclease (patch repair protein)